MHIITKTHDFQATEAIVDYVEKKLESVKKYVDVKDETTLILDVELRKETNHHRSGDIFHVDVNAAIHGKTYRVSVTKDDLYAAIDEAKDQLIAEIQKQKGRYHDLLRRGSRKIKKIIRGQFRD